MKAKTNKTAAKRFKVTKTGKIMRGKQNGRHLRGSKSKRQIRRFNKDGRLSVALEIKAGKMLPYSH